MPFSMRTPLSLSFLLLASIFVALPAGALAQDVAAPEGRPSDSTFPAPWGVPSISGTERSGFSFGDAVWSPDVDATTTTDRWDTTLTLTQDGLETATRTAEDIVLDGENAGAFEIRENTCVGEVSPGQSCGVRVGLREGVADGTYTVFVRDAVSGRSVRVTVRLERPRDVDLFISGTVFNYDVGAAAAAAGWQPGMGVNLTILPGAVVGSVGTWAPALRIGGFAGPVRQVTVLNQGRVQGAGGQGGQGTNSEGTSRLDKSYRGVWWMQGQDGGPAIRAEMPVTLINQGQIWGGGGGGGPGHCYMVYFAAGSGGGGAGTVGGAGGPRTLERYSAQGPGQPGTATAGGAPSCSAYQTGYSCPSGGVLEKTQTQRCEGGDSIVCYTVEVETGRCMITLRPPSGCTGGHYAYQCSGGGDDSWCGNVWVPQQCRDPGAYQYYSATPVFDRCGGRGGGPGEDGEPGKGIGSGRWCGGNAPGRAGAAVEGSGWISWGAVGDVRGPQR
jgi:hypothetical protein